MKRLLLITLLALVSSAPTLAQSKAEREILKLNKEYEEAIARRDASAHERLLADDYTYTPDNGNIMGREEHMNFTKKVVWSSSRSAAKTCACASTVTLSSSPGFSLRRAGYAARSPQGEESGTSASTSSGAACSIRLTSAGVADCGAGSGG